MNQIKAFWTALGPLGKGLLIGIPLLILIGLGLALTRCGGGQTEQLGEQSAAEEVAADAGLATATPADMGMLPTMAPPTAPAGACLQIPSDLPARYQQLVDNGWVPTNRTPQNFCYTSLPITGSMQQWTSEFLDGENSFWGHAVVATDLVGGSYSLPPGLARITVNGRAIDIQIVDVGPCGGANGCPGGKEPRWADRLIIVTPAVFAGLGLTGETADNVTIQSLVPPQTP